MRTYHARMLCAGLSAFFLPACLIMPGRLVPEQAMDVPATATVRRVAPAPEPPMGMQQPIMVQAGQPIQGPNGEWLMPVQMVSSPPVGSFTQPGQVLPSPVPDEEATGVIAVAHTSEPPLAPPPAVPVERVAKPIAPPPLAIAKKLPEPPAAPLPKPPSPPRLLMQSPSDVGPYPPGYQVLILQPPPGEAKPIQQTSSVGNDSVSSLLTPPMAPEELKLVSPPTPLSIDTSTGILAAMKSYQDKSPAEASRQLSHLDPATQDLLRKLLPLAVRLGDAGTQQADPSEVAEVVEQLQQVLTTLRSKAALRIEKLCYCRPPAKPRYGVFQPLPDDHAYRAGESVELYMELKNFSCEAKDSEYATNLSTVLEVRNIAGELVHRHEFARDRAETGAAPRQDYFHICRFPIQKMEPGKYTLTARITDVPSGKTAEKTLPLVIEAARRTTARGSAE